MLFDKNGEVVSYDESDIFCDDLMRADEHIDPSYYINYVGIQSENQRKHEIDSVNQSMGEIIQNSLQDG